MRILLIGNYLYSNQHSMQHFATLLKFSLQEMGHEIRLLQPTPILGRIKPGESGFGKWLGYVDRYVLFPPILKKEMSWADVIHICDHANAIYSAWLQNKHHVVTCHDMLAIRCALGEVPENPLRLSGKIYQKWILRGLEKSQYIVCVSEKTRQELIRLTDIVSDRVGVVPNALNFPYKAMEKREATKRLHRLSVDTFPPYFLHVGGNQWYKNRNGVLEIFSYLIKEPGFENHNIIMAGKPFTAMMRERIRSLDIEAHVFELIDVLNADLQALYSLAEGLIFPSLDEGFGWPIIEAQACNCPVFVSDCSPLTEIAGHGAVYFSPYRKLEAARIISRSKFNNVCMRKLRMSNVERFTKSLMIKGYLKAYRNLLQNN